jgi:predicted dehydrogenase
MQSKSRRDFLKKTAAIGVGTMFLPNFTSCAKPSGKVNIAFIGVGGRGMNNVSASLNKENPELSDNIVAFCDVSDHTGARVYEARPDVPRYTDFRKMFDEMHRDIDAVVISTPDHTHFPAAMAAMQLGKHVFVEKPLAHNVWQLRTLRKAASHYNVISQMGNQGHCSDGIRRVKEWVDSGVSGDVKEIFAWFNGPSFHEKGYFLKPENFPPESLPVPEGLDWENWLGPVGDHPYHGYIHPRFWRGWYDFGNGELGDWACHTLDAPFWALDLGSPTVVESEFSDRNPMPEKFVTNQSILRFEFPARGNKPPVILKWFEGGLKPENRPEWLVDELPGSGMIMVGSETSIRTGGRPNDSSLIMPPEEWAEYMENPPEPVIPLIPNENPNQEWLNAIKGNGPMPGSDFEYATRLTEMANIGVLAQRFDTRIEFDSEKMEISNHPELNQYLKEPVREGWEYGEDLW